MSEDDSSDSSSNDGEVDTLPTEWQVWRDRLHRHRKRFDPDVLGPYDVAVVFSGSNDLKCAFFPFLLTGEDVHFHNQAKERGGSYANELRLIIDALRHRMEEGMGEIRDNILERLHSNSPRMSRNKQEETTNCEGNHISSAHHGRSSSNGPLVVLPGLPARALPIFRSYPLRWLAVPIVDKLDNHKRELAKAHPDEVIFVEAPTVAGIIEYEKQQGPIWEQRETEDTLLALRDIHRRTCMHIETDMMEFYADTDRPEDEILKEALVMPQHNAPVPPLSKRPGLPDQNLFSGSSTSKR